MAKRSSLPSELLALSSLAVLGVYAAGYLLTEPAASLVQQASHLVPRTQASGYRDGTYLGSGRSPFGDVYVTVLVEHHAITRVWISYVTTTFSASAIGSLPEAVVSRQNAAVDLVTGATASSGAFVQAVQSALVTAGV